MRILLGATGRLVLGFQVTAIASPHTAVIAGQGDDLTLNFARITLQGAGDSGISYRDRAACSAGLQTNLFRRSESAAIVLFDFELSLARSNFGQTGGRLRLGNIVLIHRQRDGRQDGDDRDDDHQFDQGKALLLLHGESPRDGV